MHTHTYTHISSEAKLSCKIPCDSCVCLRACVREYALSQTFQGIDRERARARERERGREHVCVLARVCALANHSVMCVCVYVDTDEFYQP